MRSGAGLAVIAGVVALAGQGRAQEVVNPSWASVPEGDVMAEAYPEFASMVGLEGAVTLLCQVTPEGSLSLCVPVATVPAGLGFDQAALAVAPDFRANPRQVDGQATKSTIQFTIRFRLDGDETELPWTGPEPSERHRAAVGAMLNKVVD